MNLLVVGKDKSPLLHLPGSYLYIDDEITHTIPKRRKVTFFDVTKHHLNPLKDIDLKRARAISEIIYANSPQGENTLTVRNGKRALTRLLLSADRLDKLPRSKDDDVTEANNTIDDLLLSDVLKRVLCRATNIPLKGIILARLNRAELGDDVCFILGNLLISNYQGQVVIPDFGFYGCPFHKQLIRQNRLMAGVNYLSESELEKDLLLIEEKVASRCLAKDAEILAQYRGLLPHTVEYNDFVTDSIE